MGVRVDAALSSFRCGNELLNDLVNDGDGNLFRRPSGCLRILEDDEWA
jgi:hypothetical protein